MSSNFTDTVGRSDKNNVREMLLKGTARHFVLPSGREIEIEVTGDEASITVTNSSNITYVVYKEQENLEDESGCWTVTSPTSLIGI